MATKDQVIDNYISKHPSYANWDRDTVFNGILKKYPKIVTGISDIASTSSANEVSNIGHENPEDIKQRLIERLKLEARGAAYEGSLHYYNPPGEKGMVGSLLGGVAPYAAAEFLTGGLASVPAIARIGAGAIKAAPYLSKIPLAGKAAGFVAKRLPSMIRAGAPMAEVGFARPAGSMGERLETAGIEGLGGVTGTAITQKAGQLGAELASATSGIPKEAIEYTYKRGISNVLNDTNLADDALAKQKDVTLKVINDFRNKKGVGEKEVLTELANVGKRINEGIESRLENYGNLIENRVAALPTFANKKISTSNVTNKVLNYVDELNKFETSKLTPKEEFEINKLLKDIANVGNAKVPFPEKSIMGVPALPKETPSLRMNLPEAHKLKTVIYKEWKRQYQNPNISDKVAVAYKLAADELNQAIRVESPLYAQANDKASRLMELRDALKTVLKQKKPDQTIEKFLSTIEDKDIGTQAALNELNDFMKGDYKFKDSVNKIIKNPNYKLSARLSNILEGETGLGALDAAAKQSLAGRRMTDPYYLWKDLQGLEQKTGMPITQPLTDIAATDYYNKSTGLVKKGAETITQLGLRGLEPFAKYPTATAAGRSYGLANLLGTTLKSPEEREKDKTNANLL